MQINSLFVTLLTVAAAIPATAHVGRGVPELKQPIKRYGRGLKPSMAHRRQAAAPTLEASQAKVSGETEQCTAVALPEIEAIKSGFPTPWDNATILPGDTQAQQIWQEIQSSGIIPSGITPKGTTNGDFSSFTPTYGKDDPDCWWTFNNCVTPKHPGLKEDIWNCPEPETWGLTFDDGPNCTHNAFYDFLQQNNQKATMFYIGSNVLDWPLQAQRGLVDGHEICVHTWSHQYMTAFPDEQVFAELYYTAKVIKDVVGVTPRCWRPPFGDTDDRVRAIAAGLGLKTVIWQADTDDWRVDLPGGSTESVESNYNSILAQETAGAYKTNGTIVLTHEITGSTMDIAMKMYSKIKNSFKNVVPLTACLNNTQPYPEDITFPNFQQYVSGQILANGLPSGDNIKVESATYDPIAAASAAATQTGAAGGPAAEKQVGATKSTSGALGISSMTISSVLATVGVVVGGIAIFA